jgi:hypothetical protein
MPIKPPEANVLKPPEVKVDRDDRTPPPQVKADRDDTRSQRPPVQAALPPGQGTRVDQIA